MLEEWNCGQSEKGKGPKRSQEAFKDGERQVGALAGVPKRRRMGSLNPWENHSSGTDRGRGSDTKDQSRSSGSSYARKMQALGHISMGMLGVGRDL